MCLSSVKALYNYAVYRIKIISGMSQKTNILLFPNSEDPDHTA